MMRSVPGYISLCVPYIAVGTGMYLLGSAWAAMISYHAAMLFFAFFFGNKAYFGKERNIFSGWWYLSAIVFAAGGAIFYIVWPYVCPSSACVSASLNDFGINRGNWLYLAVYFCVINSLIEELFWRGYLGSDKKRLRIEDVAFGGYHSLVFIAFADILWALPVLAACAFAGWLWRMARAATGSLVVPILTHLCADISIVMAVHYRLYA